MSKRKKQLEEFFATYETHFNSALAGEANVEEHITASFAKCFVESSPVGVICGSNNDEFVKQIRSGFDFYKSIGSKSMNMISKDITLLDDVHAIVKVYWRYTYERDGQEGTIDFNTFYIVNTNETEPKIFAYITGDEQKALREKGLIGDREAVTQE
jgi:hypothetical protein